MGNYYRPETPLLPEITHLPFSATMMLELLAVLGLSGNEGVVAPGNAEKVGTR
jgi:hypothetical protein